MGQPQEIPKEPSNPSPLPKKDLTLIPVRRICQWVYCPRLAYLEFVEGEWADSADTAQGRRVHKRVDQEQGRLPEISDKKSKKLLKIRSVTMSSEKLGIIAKMDVVESDGRTATPVDYKKSKRPHIAASAYQPERVQVCAQAMILEDNGYLVEEGAIWYAGSRERVPVILDEELRNLTLKAITGLRTAATIKERPPPLEDSPKCPRCSLSGICLPDETNMFLGKTYPLRPLNPSDDPALPLHIQTPGARLKKSGDQLIIETKDEDKKDQKIEVPMIHVSHVSLFGPISITTPALHSLMRANIPISWFSMGGWFLGHTTSTNGNGNVAVREAQYRTAFDEERCLTLSRDIVAAKIQNSRTFLNRNWKTNQDTEQKKRVLAQLKHLHKKAPKAKNAPQLLGIEGEAASIYFAHFDRMLSEAKEELGTFSFTTRNRRPPTDPINALLSLTYAMLTRHFTSAISITGLDPYLGFYHRPRHGRPSLALDLMEPFRSIVADSSVIQAVNNGEVRPGDFFFNGPACSLKSGGRKAILRAYERRMEQQITHPIFGYQVSMRRLIEVQIRLLSRHLQGEIPNYPHYLPR